MSLILRPERDIPVGQVCAGDRLWHNGAFVEVIIADKFGDDVRLVCRNGDMPLLFSDHTVQVDIEALPHAHRYWQDGPLTIEIVTNLLGLEGDIVQSKAGIYLIERGTTLIEGEWLYGTFKEPMAHYDPTITRNEARAVLEPIFGRPLRISTVSGGYLVAVIDQDLDAASLPELLAKHPLHRFGGEDNCWLYVASLTRPQG